MRTTLTILAALASYVLALPSPEIPSTIDAKDPFSSAHWPLPRKVAGDDFAGQNTPQQGWGGIHLHDPSIVLGLDGHYWSFSTHGLVAISRARKHGSLEGYWEVLGSVLVNESAIVNAGRTDPWAPDVHLINGMFYCYYAVSQFGSQHSSIGVATSLSLEPGSWQDHGAVITTAPNASWPLNVTNAIDGNYFFDGMTGKEYLTYGSFWSDIYQFQLKSSRRDVETTPAPVQLSLDPVSPQAEEGAFLHYSCDYYYLFFSHGQCCGFNSKALPAPGLEYSIRVGRSKSATGPFVDMDGKDLKAGGGTIVFGSHDYVYAPGGQGVLSNYHNKDVLYYHYINTTSNPKYADEYKLLGWNYIDYINGWPVLKH